MNIKQRSWMIYLPLLVVMGIGFAIWLVIYNQKKAYSIRTHCVGNIIRITIAKKLCQTDLDLDMGEVISIDELEKRMDISGLSLAEHKCFAGGQYIIGPVGTTPKCTYTNVVYTYTFEPPFGIERREWYHEWPAR